MVMVENETNELFVSSISLWEIAQKTQAGKLQMDVPLEKVRRIIEEDFGAEILSFKAADCMHLAVLPPLHKDPFDRMLMCQAIEGGMALVTDDVEIRRYPIKTCW